MIKNSLYNIKEICNINHVFIFNFISEKQMNIKKFGILGCFWLLALFIAWCGQKTPNLSFEETLNVWKNETSSMEKIVDFLNDSGTQLKNNLWISANFTVGDTEKWEIKIESDSSNDNSTKDSQANAVVAFNMDNWQGDKISGSLDLDTIFKDYQIFLKLNSFDLQLPQTDDMSIFAMINAMATSLKEKWITYDNPELMQMLKDSTTSNTDLLKEMNLWDEDLKTLFKDEESTTYNWKPAWKVSLNEETLRNIILAAYDHEQQESLKLYAENEEIISDLQESRAEFEQNLNNIKLDNQEVYLVINSWKDVDLVVANLDIVSWESVANVKEVTDWKTTTYEITMDAASETNPDEKEQIKVTLVLKKWKINYDFSLDIDKITKSETEKLYAMEWTLSLSLTEKALAFNADVKLSNDTLSANVKAKYSSEKTSGITFEKPENAEDLWWLVESLLGVGMQEDLGDFWEEYDYDVEWEYVAEEISTEEPEETAEEAVVEAE